MTVFLDTFALIAWINSKDVAHPLVTSFLKSFSGRIVTTEWVLIEFADAFSMTRSKPLAIEAIKRIRRLPMFEVVGLDPSILQSGFDLYESRLDKDWSLTDCISFTRMTSKALTDALTADHHFEQAGFRALFKTT
jgi:uncharacterized protein